MKKIQLLFLTYLSSHFAIAQTEATPQWRPVYHFSPAKNWTNDPNGLIYFNGTYHLYNQQNPFENKWGHMSWGHATSNDLLHFNPLPIALPETIDRDTTWRFSGCVVYDKNNTSGFCKNGGCLVAVYTVCQPNRKLQSQWIAYSNNGGKSYTNYEKNPVIDLNMEDFRDPNVRWDATSQQWVMTVAMPREHAVRFYKSPNLKDWTFLSEFGNNSQGFCKHHWECPFLVQLLVDGNEKDKRWVLFVSSWGPEDGPFMQYFTGNFDGKKFTSDNPGSSWLTVDEGNTLYAAIPFNNQPQGKEILVGWMVPLQQPTFPWRGQFSIPRDLKLHRGVEGVRLVQQPSSVVRAALDKLPAGKKFSGKNISLNDGVVKPDTKAAFQSNAIWIKATFTIGTAKTLGFRLNESGNRATQIVYDTRTEKLSVLPVQGQEIHPLHLKMKPINGKINLEILLDQSTLEVFANEGEKVITTLVFPRKGETGWSVFATGGKGKMDDISVYNLE